jgi:hypothetical protein
MTKRLIMLTCVLLLASASMAQEAVSLPAGTAVRMKLETPISTTISKAGDTFSGRVTQPVMHEGKTVIPVGASVQGKVVRVSEPRRIKGRPTIELRPESVTMPDGSRFALNAVVVDTDPAADTEVDDEGKIKGKGRDGADNRNLIIGTAGGGTIGAIAGGGKGLLVGAAVGATAAVTYWLTKRKTAELVAGTEIIMELSRPMSMAAAEAD